MTPDSSLVSLTSILLKKYQGLYFGIPAVRSKTWQLKANQMKIINNKRIKFIPDNEPKLPIYNFQRFYFFLEKKVTKIQDEKMLPRTYLTHTPLFRRANAHILLTTT